MLTKCGQIVHKMLITHDSRNVGVLITSPPPRHDKSLDLSSLSRLPGRGRDHLGGLLPPETHAPGASTSLLLLYLYIYLLHCNVSLKLPLTRGVG